MNLLKKEDYWAIWIGGALLVSGLILFFGMAPSDWKEQHQSLVQIMSNEKKAPFETIAYYQAYEKQQGLKATSLPFGKTLSRLTAIPNGWSDNPVRSFYAPANKEASMIQKIEDATKKAEGAFADAQKKEAAARNRNFADESLNSEARAAIAAWRASSQAAENLKDKAKAGKYSLPYTLALAMLLLGVFGTGAWFMGDHFIEFAKGFLLVFLVGTIAYFLAANSSMKAIGFGYAAWAILIGLLVSNTIGTPAWAEKGLRTEYYIKTGLVLLGAEVLFNKIMAIGLPGIFVAWIVTPVVLVSTYWFGQKILKIPSKTLNMTISADMSVCGVSAAVATAAACNAKKEELTLAIGLSMIFTSVMMIVLPAVINAIGIPEVLGGAWIGGTIDSTGAVVAAGAFLGDKALNVAATIKMIQNILIGLIAFGVAVYFSTRVEKSGARKVGISEIWKRFPKFILGFLGASILFSLIYSGVGDDMAYSVIDQGVLRGFTRNLRSWLFCLAFVSIGLSTNFKTLRHYFTGGKPLVLYLCGQGLNLALTLLMAYLMFYKFFPEITNQI